MPTTMIVQLIFFELAQAHHKKAKFWRINCDSPNSPIFYPSNILPRTVYCTGSDFRGAIILNNTSRIFVGINIREHCISCFCTLSNVTYGPLLALLLSHSVREEPLIQTFGICTWLNSQWCEATICSYFDAI